MNNEKEILEKIFEPLYKNIIENNLVVDKTGVKISEVLCKNLYLDPKQKLLDFGVKKTNEKYCQKELKWYDSQDLNVDPQMSDITIWKQVADKKEGKIISNYGYRIYSKECYEQYNHALQELKNHPQTRRSIIIYTEPNMWNLAFENGRSDFICTNFSQHFIRNNKLIYVISQRSMDMIFGFFNDFYWHCIVYERMFNDLKKEFKNLEYGSIIYQPVSAHIYERHFNLLKEIIELKI